MKSLKTSTRSSYVLNCSANYFLRAEKFVQLLSAVHPCLFRCTLREEETPGTFTALLHEIKI